MPDFDEMEENVVLLGSRIGIRSEWETTSLNLATLRQDAVAFLEAVGT
jgi:hypothetical protein